MPPSFIEPQQTRSRRTLERIVSATETLLVRQPFASVTVDEIVAEADASKGSFYNRFADKESLIDYLSELHFDQLAAAWRRFLEPTRWNGTSLRRLVGRIMVRQVRLYRRRRHVLRALAIHARSSDQRELTKKAAGFNREIVAMYRSFFEGRCDELPRTATVDDACQAMTFTSAIAREVILFGDGPGPLRLPDPQLTTTLERLFWGYLNEPKPNHMERLL